MARSSSSGVDSLNSSSRLPTSAPSSPPQADDLYNVTMGVTSTFTEQRMLNEEKKARDENTRAEAKRLAAKRKRKKVQLSPQERARKAKELDELLRKSKIFSDILTQKTKALGRVGRDFDNQALADAGLQLKQQPKIMSGGTMRDYQLEGLTWMYEICLQGLSGILADEMGLGKTIQVISLVALLREQESYFGPHLIIAPLSTLSNWQDEFQKWTPTIPFVMYHGTPQERQEIFRTKIMRNYQKGRPSQRFPVVCTSYEMVLRDRASLSKIDWAFIVVDEGHRMKNADAKLFRELQQFKSATRLLITGTPLQNNLKELWSLLHFLMPETFLDWEAFEVWFDFSDLQDEEGTTQFIEDKQSQDLVSKIHKVLQPLLLRRIKADVANYLPKKREYVLYAPMTKEQTDLYNVIGDKKTDTRSYLESKVVERLTETRNSPSSRKSSRQSSRVTSANTSQAPSPPAKNAFSMMMGKKGGSTLKVTPKDSSPASRVRGTSKRKVPPTSEASSPKSSKSSRQSTPAGSIRGRPRRARASYKVADDSDDDKLDDDAFEAKLASELAAKDDESDEDLRDEEEIERAATLEMAKLQIADKKLGNPIMQLRLVCNSPHNFYNPWTFDDKVPIDESIVTASGKMLLLDRLLPELFSRDHKVLIFSQFKTQLDILHDYCSELRGWNVCRIDGGVAQEDRKQQIKEFNENSDFKIFLLSTRAGGQGINLASADTVILFDSDWNPQQDLQAQDRAHRIGQTRPVVVYRLATKGTVEEELLMSADAKRRLEKLVIKKGGFRTMGQKLDSNEVIDKEILQSLLLKDGEEYQHSGGDRILSDEDIDVLCDRSDDAFDRAARGAGNADGFQVVETAADGITQMKGE
ncbi:SNF2 family N-terminal domain-containing protein [Annulohypoxylon maeteangense]|uniref:SNF2 family N-terminal domain-containing protein n=1 Tax=Annulohypoxylon maeteangense TaxID=1927788 RepID=UPI0020072C9E|nr:SNF2 family N-terminal domain-containing protein [Annulohypoxylon maeteangense]KAI0888735.1 SNF2 family N-terminal domain-containing protein [Annulohypoxylon maeteangense]